MIFRCGTLKYILYTSLYIIWQKSCTLLCLATINKKKNAHFFLILQLRCACTFCTHIFKNNCKHVFIYFLCTWYFWCRSCYSILCFLCYVCFDFVFFVYFILPLYCMSWFSFNCPFSHVWIYDFFFKICTRPKQKYMCVYCHPFDKHLVGR